MTVPIATQQDISEAAELANLYPYFQCGKCFRDFTIGPVSARYRPLRCSQCKGDHVSFLISRLRTSKRVAA